MKDLGDAKKIVGMEKFTRIEKRDSCTCRENK